jgi:pilus assembly protein CpaB
VRNRSNLLVLLGIAFFVVGGIIVYVLTSDDDDSGASGSETVTVVVATKDIPAGSLADDILADGGVKETRVPADALQAGAVQSVNQLEGATFVQGFAAESQVIGAGLQSVQRGYDLPEGFEAIAVSLNFPQGVAGYVNPGDRVNLYGSFTKLTEGGEAVPNGEHAQLMMSNVRVLDVNKAIPAAGVPADGTATNRQGDGAIVFLLAVRTADAERIVYMEQGQAIYATLVHGDAAPAGPTDGANAGNILSSDLAASAA